MTEEANQSIKRGSCPCCGRPHFRDLRRCQRCGETVCRACWVGGQILCANCLAEVARDEGFKTELEWSVAHYGE